MPILEIKNAELSIDNKKILKGLSLNVNEGETHALWVQTDLEKVRFHIC